MAKILVVDDEKKMRNLIIEYLNIEGFDWDEAGDGEEALVLFSKNYYDLIILDVMMPRMDGWSVCREIRKKSDKPVIMLTARGEEYDKLFGFELGVDDYIVKPFSPKELIARIKVILRRSNDTPKNKEAHETLAFKDLIINISSKNVSLDGRIIKLTPKEYDLLLFLLTNRDRALSRQQILDKVWGYDYYGDDRTVDTHIKMLRESLGQYRKHIVTIWATGYKFETGEE